LSADAKDTQPMSLSSQYLMLSMPSSHTWTSNSVLMKDQIEWPVPFTQSSLNAQIQGPC
jgi:hypothetical protein